MVAKKNLLIVDDNTVNRKMLIKILGGDYNIAEAKNGVEALEILHRDYQSIAVVLLDIIMPVMDGYEVLQQMHSDAFLSKIPVIVASGQDGEDAEIKALSLGAADYILKPFKAEFIRHRVANTIYLTETSSFMCSVQRDSLTGLLGKEYFYLKVAEALRANPNGRFDLLCFDIERFKLVNDVYGVTVGDRLLKHIGDALLRSLGEDGLCGRIGADEFACLIEHRTDYTNEYFAEFNTRISQFDSAVKLNLIMRYGIYYIEDTTTPVSLMCDRAILVKESIKGKYQTFFAYYDDTIRQKLLDEQMLVSDMKPALAADQFKVYYQPKYSLKTGHIIGAEALVRWQHPVKGLLAPAAFIPLFEKNGFISDLDFYVWEQCCKVIRNWIDNGNRPIPISANVSRVDTLDPELPERLLRLVQKYELSPCNLNLEITESAYTENAQQLISMVTSLKRLGFHIEMDDFGTGYSSLNMLSVLPMDILKLDMRFMQQSEMEAGGRSVLSFVMSLAKWMNLKVVAEGVETAEQVHLLQSLNCDYAQGYYYARPMPRHQFETHLLSATIISGDGESEAFEPSSITVSGGKLLLALDGGFMDIPRLQRDLSGICTVLQASDCHEVESELQSNKSELCAVTVSLPFLGGREALEGLTDACRLHSVPAIALYDPSYAPDKAMSEIGFVDLISRSVQPWQLVQRLKNAFAYAKLDDFKRENEINAAILEMRKRAEHDSLTGLLNRAEYEVRLDSFFHNNEHPDGVFLIMDVDNFKSVNDNFGHVAGDSVLCSVAEHLRRTFPETEIIARIGGDEFSLFIPYTMPNDRLKAKLEQLSAGFSLTEPKLTITCSVGVCFSPENGTDHKQLYKNADTALLSAKRYGKHQFKIFEHGMELSIQPIPDSKTVELLDNTSDALFISDASNGDIIFINKTACRMLKSDRSNCLGQKCYELFWNRSCRCDRCKSIGNHTKDFYEETALLNDSETKINIKARLEQWGDRRVKVHYLQNVAKH